MSRLALWFFPAWCGDFRLEARDDGTTLLTVINPTSDDRLKLDPFLAECVKRGWTEERNWFDVFRGSDPNGNGDLYRAPAITEAGESVIRLGVKLTEAAPLLAASAHGDSATWTALRCEGGVILVDGVKIPADAAPTAAATVQPPKKGCPAPTPAERRASEVLRTFSTKKQWSQWNAEGRMRLIGQTSGKAYHLYHRDEAAARNLPNLLIEASTQQPICIWDDRVPPAEEALAIKLGIEHRERWTRGLQGAA